jgi:hypothetical protein
MIGSKDEDSSFEAFTEPINGAASADVSASEARDKKLRRGSLLLIDAFVSKQI